MTTKAQKIIEELILIILIATTLLELTGFMPGEASFGKSIISITAIGYVLYKASFSDIFFGEKNHKLDTFILLSYFLMILNKFIYFIGIYSEKVEYLEHLANFLSDYRTQITLLSLIIGTFIIFLISIWVAKHFVIKSPSIMNAIHGENIHNPILKFVTVFILLIGFFTVFFNPVVEWFTLVIDAPIVVIALFLYIFKIHNIGKNQDSEEILFKIAESVDIFLEKFINLFHSKKTLFFAVSGILIFHLFADIAVFIIPYVLGTHNTYHDVLSENNQNIYQLFQLDKVVIAGVENHFIIFMIYILNVLGILYLMLYPAYVWYVMYIDKINKTEKNPEKIISIDKPKKFFIALFFALMVFQIFLPVFSISSFSNRENQNLYGVNIQSRAVSTYDKDFGLYLVISFLVFSVVYFLCNFPSIKNSLFVLMSIFGVIFLGLYTYQYYKSIIFYYYNNFLILIPNLTFLSIYFILFNLVLLLIQTLFYVGGYYSFVLHMFHDKK